MIILTEPTLVTAEDHVTQNVTKLPSKLHLQSSPCNLCNLCYCCIMLHYSAAVLHVTPRPPAASYLCVQ